ncbi:MAG TPA: M81 family peptidase [Rhodospirillales bacterium]|nr:M81 family peptidase [Rhodospirillales bacterium]
MARIAIGGLHHETNSFAPQPASFERFLEADAWPPLSRGGDIFANTEGANLAITGFVEAARARGHDLVPLVWANAQPSGPVTEDAFERLAAMLIADLERSLPVDALFLDLHGAMVTEHLEDGEGELLARIRRKVPGLPIVCALDLHANVSGTMVAHSDALVAYRTYPHVDLAETGARCLPVLERRLADEPLHAWHAKGGYLIPLPWQCTDIAPAAGLYDLLRQLERDGVASLSLCMGFPASDTSACGPSVLAYGTPEAAAKAGDELAAALAEAEAGFAGRLWSPAEAVAHARRFRRDGPVVLADTQDNPGGGGSSDTTGLLVELVRQQADEAALALMADPEAAAAAHAAGGGTVLRNLPLGGRHGPEGVEPFVCDWRVEALGDGRFVATGPMYRGNQVDLGPMALLSPVPAPGVKVLVSTRRLQAADQAIFRHLGIEPARMRILVLKSSVHFRADFAPIAGEILVVAAPGHVIVDPCALPFTRLPPERRCAPRSA